MTEESNYFMDLLFRPAAAELFSAPEVLLAMTISTLLSFILSVVYRTTHRGTSYSQSFILTMFVMSIATAVVMMIIGSNIARAFSLVGALSIIRFRTAVKDPRDTSYLFASMIGGMGCGTQFYMAAIMMTLFISGLVLVLYAFDYGIKGKLESILRITFVCSNNDPQDQIEAHLGRSFRNFRMINRILDFGPDEATNVYVVRPGPSTDHSAVEQGLREIEGVVNLSVYQSDQHAPF